MDESLMMKCGDMATLVLSKGNGTCGEVKRRVTY